MATALRLVLGGAPAGPAGTGKTETVKDLGKSLGLASRVLNCGPDTPVASLRGALLGLAGTGAFGCFDEFNRLRPGVLSVAAAMLASLQTAIITAIAAGSGAPSVGGGGGPALQPSSSGSAPALPSASSLPRHRPGRPVAAELPAALVAGEAAGSGPAFLVPTCAPFITMNPGYAGRAELPENLKALFRPVAMTRPDSGLIAENVLLAHGFQAAKTVAQRLTRLWQAASQQLPCRHRYDFGLRALMSALDAATARRHRLVVQPRPPAKRATGEEAAAERRPAPRAREALPTQGTS
ncbi:hypothetical protein FNF27_06934 [Cafeteria roenbergensis]|uniref:Dynein heavy chain hydrolytic ATP-binding dynein motor region domain-containing protein n=1 Tax=Cafeteria roenbergensis TaxID=33653 RepID=A0A5A8DWB9_CAFRO|nr:hypothetical protein FNF27_06934 [Cafeteria roenbergensis]